ncbi:SPOR domain-containing protein [Luteimonas sp. e5]
MIGRMLLVALLVLNLGVAAWWWLHRPVPPPAGPALDPGIPTLELVEDAIEEAEPASRPGAAVDDEEAAMEAPPESEVAPVAAAPNPAAEAVPVCAAFGPYADRAAAEAARSRLSAADARGSLREVATAPAAGTTRGYNVYLPPLADREAASAMAERLRAAGFNDLMLINQGERANGIALGRFGNEANARRHQATLRARGFAAEVAPIVTEGEAPSTQFWLDVRAAAGFDPVAQRTRLGAAQVQRRRCPDA